MYTVNKSMKILQLLQELYQQEVISREDKNMLANVVKKSLKTKSYMELKMNWKTAVCLNEKKRNMMNELYIILEEKR